jgi:hypothetical protein
MSTRAARARAGSARDADGRRATHLASHDVQAAGGFMTRFVLAIAALLVLGAAPLVAQQQPAAPPTWEQAAFNTWKSLHDKILVMAKDTQFPDDKLGWKPHPDSRSVLDEFRHVTIGLEMVTAQLSGTPFNYMERMKADDSKPKTRASVVAEMEAAYAKSLEVVKSSVKPNILFWLDHQGEHYGKLVSNYRMNNIVPPVSRPRK